MTAALFVANLDETVTADDLRALFAAHGEVAAVEISTEPHVNEPIAVVEMATEKQATRALNALNGMELAGKRLYVSYLLPDLDKDMTPRQRKTVQEIVTLLGESEAKPLRQIEAIVYVCGGRFAEVLAEEALAIDAQGGMFTADGTRRTKGGIFFYLARFRMSPEARRIVYNRGGKLPARQ
jgi:RNA recognition motif-containing protein